MSGRHQATAALLSAARACHNARPHVLNTEVLAHYNLCGCASDARIPVLRIFPRPEFHVPTVKVDDIAGRFRGKLFVSFKGPRQIVRLQVAFGDIHQQQFFEGGPGAVIDKNVDVLTRIADRHYIIKRGRVVWAGTSPALASAPDIQHRYLGI